MLGRWRSGATTVGESRCRPGTSSRSPSTGCCASASRGSSTCGSPTPCRGSGWPPFIESDLLDRIRDGAMTVREQRGLGLPWSELLVERGRRSVGGTLAAARRALAAWRGDEPRRRHPPRGPRLRARLLPVQRRRGDGGAAARRGARAARASSSTATSTRATARRRSSAPTPTRSRSRCTARATTRSSASRPTWTWICRPEPATTSTCARCRTRSTRRPARTLAFFLAGADPWEGDRLGRLALTKAGLRARDEFVLARLRGIPTTVVLAGGYAPDVNDTVDINAATRRSRARRKLKRLPGA